MELVALQSQASRSPVDSDVECPLEAKILQTEIELPL